MSTKPMKPLAGLPGKGGTQVQVDLRDAETIKCNYGMAKMSLANDDQNIVISGMGGRESINISEIDPGAKDMPIAREKIDGLQLKTVMTNSFGFGGTNASIIFKKHS